MHNRIGCSLNRTSNAPACPAAPGCPHIPTPTTTILHGPRHRQLRPRVLLILPLVLLSLVLVLMLVLLPLLLPRPGQARGRATRPDHLPGCNDQTSIAATQHAGTSHGSIPLPASPLSTCSRACTVRCPSDNCNVRPCHPPCACRVRLHLPRMIAAPHHQPATNPLQLGLCNPM